MARIRKHQDVRLKFLSTNISRAKGRKDGKEIMKIFDKDIEESQRRIKKT